MRLSLSLSLSLFLFLSFSFAGDFARESDDTFHRPNEVRSICAAGRSEEIETTMMLGKGVRGRERGGGQQAIDRSQIGAEVSGKR